MVSHYRRFLLTAVALLLASAALPAMAADSFPTKPIHIIVPFAPGGHIDQTASLRATIVIGIRLLSGS